MISRNGEIMIDRITISLFLFIYTLGIGYLTFIVWLRFPEYRARVLKWYEPQKSSKWSFAHYIGIWVSHGSYKWFVRIISALMTLGGGIALLANLYSLLRLIV
jgi:hypothetical protein